MNQHSKLLSVLNDGKPHCVVELREGLYCYDYRKRLSEIKAKGYNLISEPCGGRCGRNHSAQLHQWTLKEKHPYVKSFDLKFPGTTPKDLQQALLWTPTL